MVQIGAVYGWFRWELFQGGLDGELCQDGLDGSCFRVV